MQTIFEYDLGGDDGGKAGLYIDGGLMFLKISYPMETFTKPMAEVMDNALASIKASLPQDMDKSSLDSIGTNAKASMTKLLSKPVGP